MKKIIAVLCVAFALAFCGCGVLENPYSSSSSQDAASESVSETPSAEDSSVEDSVGGETDDSASSGRSSAVEMPPVGI